MEPGFLRGVWDAVVSDQAQNFAQLVMASTVVLACLEYMHGRRRDRTEALDKRKAAEEELKIKREEIDAALVEQYIAVLDDFIEHPELDNHHVLLPGPQARQQNRIYEKLILLFATAFRRLHGEEDVELQEQWYSWEDDIADWLALPNFRTNLDDLLTGETEAFSDYMQGKKSTINESAAPEVSVPGVKKLRRSRRSVSRPAELGTTPSVSLH